MKNRKIKGLIAALFALAMAVSVGTTLSCVKVQKHPEIVLAEDEAETPTTDEAETPSESEETAPKADSSESSKESGGSSSISSSITPKKVIKLILRVLKDALKDLRDHIKRWFYL